MNGLAEELLTEAILDQLTGWYAEKDCPEFLQINRHRPHDRFSVIISWNSSLGDTTFALVVFSNKLLGTVQDAIDEEIENLYEMYFERIQDWAVFRAVTQDDGGTFIWQADEQVLVENYFLR